MAYTKLHQSLVTSTVWREPSSTRIVWITMLALADKNGEVMGSIPGLADLSRVTIPECEAALKAFLSPDPYSRTKVLDGIRIEEIDGGWSLVNHAKYREMASREDAVQKASARTARYRKNRALRAVDAPSPTVDSDAKSTHDKYIAESREQRADSESKGSTPNPAPVGSGDSVESLFSAEIGKPISPKSDAIDAIYQAYPRKKEPAHARKAIAKALKLIHRSGPLDGHETAESYLLDRVKAYAEAMRLQEKQFIPYPATWFNAESYNENQTEWTMGQAPAGSPVINPRNLNQRNDLNGAALR